MQEESAGILRFLYSPPGGTPLRIFLAGQFRAPCHYSNPAHAPRPPDRLPAPRSLLPDRSGPDGHPSLPPAPRRGHQGRGRRHGRGIPRHAGDRVPGGQLLSPEQGRLLAQSTFAGAAALAQQSPLSPATLREQVTSKGGTTYAAITSLDHSGVKAAFVQALHAARDRATELGRG